MQRPLRSAGAGDIGPAVELVCAGVASFYSRHRLAGVFVSAFMERVGPVVDATIAALSRTRFIDDPVAGVKYSRATSIISSAYKRHGKILETAIRRIARQ